jgi:hypothetical protein
MFATKFLFNHESFLQELQPLISQADTADYRQLFLRARAIAERIRSHRRKWVLEGLGTGLSQFGELPPVPRLVGFYFLVILSQYLRPTRWRASGYSHVRVGLQQLGWDRGKLDQFVTGMYTVTLLKADWLPNPYEIQGEPKLLGDDLAPAAYPWYVVPGHATSTRWMTRQQVEGGYEELRAAKRDFLKLDWDQLGRTGHAGAGSPHSSAPLAFGSLLQLYGRAVKNGCGLWSVSGY